MRWPQWLRKTGLARFVPRIHPLGGAGKMSGKGRANPGAQSETGTLEALGPSRRAKFRM